MPYAADQKLRGVICHLHVAYNAMLFRFHYADSYLQPGNPCVSATPPYWLN